MRSTAKNITIWGGSLLSLGLLYYALHGIDWPKTLLALKNTRWFELTLAVILMWTGFFWRAIRWKRLIDTERPISIGQCFTVLTIGYMANNVLPARIGEFARAYLLSRRNGVSKSFALGTIVIERLGDVLMLVLLITTTLVLLPLPADAKNIAVASATVAAVATVGLFGGVVFRERIEQRIVPVLGGFIGEHRARRIEEIVNRFLVGVSCGGSFKVVSLAGIDSLGIWLIGLLMTWEVGQACNVDVGITQILFVMCVVNLGAMVPSAPGYLGTYQASCVFALSTVFKVEKELALAFSVVCHIVWYLPTTLLGVIFFLRERMTLGQLQAGAEAVEHPGTGG